MVTLAPLFVSGSTSILQVPVTRTTIKSWMSSIPYRTTEELSPANTDLATAL